MSGLNPVFCVCAATLRDTLNETLREAGLPWGLSVELALGEAGPVTHCAQHSSESAETIALLEQVDGLQVFQRNGGHADGKAFADEVCAAEGWVRAGSLEDVLGG